LSDTQRELGVEGSVVEIGVHHGRLFIGMHLTRAPGESSLAIDLFGRQDQNVDRSGRGDEAVFRQNLRRHTGSDENVDILTADSTTLTGQTIRDRVGPARLFDVDGGHTAAIVLHDLQTASEALEEGGLVLSDDQINEQWPGVQEGTGQFAASDARLVPFGVGFNKTMFTTRAHVERYRETLVALARRHCWDYKQTAMYGEVICVVWRSTYRRRAKLLVKYRILNR
jgi:hypothetical protein